MDFVSDTLSSGRTFRCLNIVDEFSRECVALYPSHSIPAVRVIDVLERLRQDRGLPKVIVTDNGSEFMSRAFDAWAYARGVRIDFIQPGKPVQNCFVESFNRTFRDDCLNMHWFVSLADAARTIEAWRTEYNGERPHSSLRGLTPAEFRQEHQQRENTLATTPEFRHNWINFGGHLSPFRHPDGAIARSARRHHPLTASLPRAPSHCRPFGFRVPQQDLWVNFGTGRCPSA